MKKIASCIVCNSKEFTSLFETYDRMFDIPGTFIIKRCKICRLVFVDPQPSQKILENHYPSKLYYSYQSGEKKGLFIFLRSYLVKHYYNPTFLSRFFSSLVQNVPAMPKKRQGRILDVGCGTGDTIALLAQLGWDMYGLDIDKKAVSIAKKRGLRNVTLGSYKGMRKYPDNYFDVIRLYHVIEHLANPNLCLQLMYQKLKTGGEVIMGTPNCESVTSWVFKKFWVNLDTPRHLFVFSPTTLSKITKREGFSDIHIEFCSAGGLIGSIVYVIGNMLHRNLNPENHLWFVLPLYPFVYPLEWLFDKLKIGDIFVLRASKN